MTTSTAPMQFPVIFLRTGFNVSTMDAQAERQESADAGKYWSDVHAVPLAGPVNDLPESASILTLTPLLSARSGSITQFTQVTGPKGKQRYYRQAIITGVVDWHAALKRWRSKDWIDPRQWGPVPPQGVPYPREGESSDSFDGSLKSFLEKADWTGGSVKLKPSERKTLLVGVVNAVLNVIQHWSAAATEDRVHLIVNAEPDVLLTLLHGVARLLPNSLLAPIGFTTLAAFPDGVRLQLGTVPVMGICHADPDYQELLDDLSGRYWVIDAFLLGRHDPSWMRIINLGRPAQRLDTKFIRQIVDWQLVDPEHLKAKKQEFAAQPARTVETWRALCMRQDGRTASVRPCRLVELLREGHFDRWEQEFVSFFNQANPTQKEHRLVAEELIQFAADAPESIPFSIRIDLYQKLRSRFSSLFAGKTGNQRSLVLTGVDDLQELRQRPGVSPTQGLGVPFGKLLALSVDWGKHCIWEDPAAAQAFYREMAVLLLESPPEISQENDLVCQFIASCRRDYDTSSEESLLLGPLLRAAEDRCLQLFLTIVHRQMAMLRRLDRPWTEAEFDSSLKEVKQLYAHQDLNFVLKQDELAYARLNDLDWSPSCRDCALDPKCLELLLRLHRQITSPDDLLEQLETLWDVLLGAFDQQLLDDEERKKDSGMRRRFQWMKEVRMNDVEQWDSDVPLMSNKTKRELKDWIALDEQCGPIQLNVRSKWSDFYKSWLSRRHSRGRHYWSWGAIVLLFVVSFFTALGLEAGNLSPNSPAETEGTEPQ